MRLTFEFFSGSWGSFLLLYNAENRRQKQGADELDFSEFYEILGKLGIAMSGSHHI
jgi:hypothetical protein